MGKGIIKSGGADGFYSVELTFERDRIDKTVSRIDAHIESLTSVIDTMDEGTEKELLKLERNSYIKKKEYLQNNMPEDPIVSAWCADLTEDITGNVGTIEVPGERGIVQIQPGYESNSTYDSIRDGQLQPSIAGTPAATFYNLAILPGWQKWKPTYRYGVISNIDTDANTCDVKLDYTESSQQNLNINQELNLTGISVSYMSCDSVAFEDGDNVLVKFEGQTWEGAQVVGFKDNPVACGFQFKITRGDGILITEESGLLDYIELYRRVGLTTSITTPIYNPVTEYWSFNLSNIEDQDQDGYWIQYSCDDGIVTQYPYQYLPDDKYDVDNKIQFGKYDDTIPFYVIGSQSWQPIRDYSHGTSTEFYWSDIFPEGWGDLWISGSTRAGHWRLIDPSILGLTRDLFIKSSVPYKVTYHGYAKALRELFYTYGDVPSYSFDDDCYYEITSDGGNKTITPGGDGLESTVIHEPSVSGRNHSLDVTFIPRVGGSRVIAIDYPSGLGIGPIGMMVPAYII